MPTQKCSAAQRGIAWPALAVVLLSTSIFAAQTTAVPQSLSAAVAVIASDPNVADGDWVTGTESILRTTSLSEIKANLPKLVDLTDSPNPKIRTQVMFLLYALASRTVDDQRRMDTTVAALFVPYLPRFAPHLSDSYEPMRNVTFLVFAAVGSIRPAPSELLDLTLDLLKHPGATEQLTNPTDKSLGERSPYLGAKLLWIVLPAGAMFDLDPKTGITEGHDSPDVQTAIIGFIHRPDQTSESRAETLRALALSQVQDTAVHAALLPWLTRSDPDTQLAVLKQLSRFTLGPEDNTQARAVVGNLADDPQTPAKLRSAAAKLLLCWHNDQPGSPCLALP